MNRSGELFIPPRMLDYGLYEIKLIVTMNNLTRLSAETKIYLNVVRSAVIVRLIPSAVSSVSHYYRQDLKLDPGAFSIDPDSDTFNTTVRPFLRNRISSGSVLILGMVLRLLLPQFVRLQRTD